MFKHSFTKYRVDKAVRPSKRSYRDKTVEKMEESLDSPPPASPLTSSIVTIVVGHERRIFAAHEDVLSRSAYFASVFKDQFLEPNGKKVDLVDEEPEVLSCILEFLYKGDYFPRLLHKRRHTWELEDAQDVYKTGGRGSSMATMFHSGVNAELLRDTVVYCAAEKYGLDELKHLALRKQGLQSGIPVDIILRSARYAYEHTPDTESRLRAHYLAMIIRSRKIFRRSGTMQMEMEIGGKLFFDLFVAMSNHIDDIVEIGNSRSPKFI